MTQHNSEEELRAEVTKIIEAELSVSEVVAYAAGNKGAITNIMIEQIMQLISSHDEKIKREAKLEGRIEAGIELRKSMISTSPFVEQVLNPYLTEQRRVLKLSNKESEEK